VRKKIYLKVDYEGIQMYNAMPSN